MKNNVEIIQINISGEDKPGMTSSLTEILARYDAFILDIGQANIHQSLTLGILFMTTSDKSGNIMKELLFKSSELGVMIRFTPISEEKYNDWVSRQGKNRYIITLLGRTVTARHIAEVTKVVAEQGLNIDAIKRLTGRMPLERDDRAAKSCIELSVRGSLTDEQKSTMQERFMNLSEIGLDVSFQKDDIYRRSRRLICFDMDSTLIETEVIDELADRAGVGDKVRAITESAMRGEIDFRESFTRRVALLRGLDVSVMEDIATHLPITEGLERMMTILKRVGYKTAILSGGFTYFGNYLRRSTASTTSMPTSWKSPTASSRAAMRAKSSTDAARPSCCGCSASSRKSTSPSRWPWATEPTTCRCSTWRVWASPSTPNPRSRRRPASPSRPSVWTASSTSSV